MYQCQYKVCLKRQIIWTWKYLLDRWFYHFKLLK